MGLPEPGATQMTRSTDFSAYFVAKWKDGAFPKAVDGNTVVNYDQTNHAYDIAAEDMAAFVEWVADNWQSDNDPRGLWDEAAEDMVAEAAQDYLDRRGISVREV
jgi:hypothetical protein